MCVCVYVLCVWLVCVCVHVFSSHVETKVQGIYKLMKESNATIKQLSAI